MKVCLREKKSEITSWVTCGHSPLLVYTVVKRSFFYTSSLTESIVLVSISVSNKQNINVATLVALRDYNSHLNLVYRCYILIISSNGSSSGNTGNSRSSCSDGEAVCCRSGVNRGSSSNNSSSNSRRPSTNLTIHLYLS